jgi:copper chaperone CopZ
MKQKIKISGMTCESCVTSVTEKLIGLDQVEDLKIDLASGSVEMEVLKIQTLKNLSEVLFPKYIPSFESKSDNSFPMKESTSKLKQLYPLFLILFTWLWALYFYKKTPFVFPIL